MTQQLIRRTLPAVGILLLLLDPDPARASLFFRPADPGPVVSNVLKVVPYASGALAFEESGTFLLGDAGWEPFVTTANDPRLGLAPLSVTFVAGGSLFGLTRSGEKYLLSRLSPTRAWQVLAEIDRTAGDPSESASNTRLYAFSGGRFVSVSLEDGAETAEPSWPVPGRFSVVSGKPMLVGASGATGGPVYRLDASGWTGVGDWDARGTKLYSSPSAIWSIESSSEVRRLSSDGRSDSFVSTFPLCRATNPYRPTCDGLTFTEWGAEVLTRDPATGFVYRLHGGSFVPFEPAPPYPRIERLDASGDRLFAFGEDSSLYVFDRSRWQEIPAPGGRPGATAYFQGEGPLHAVTTYEARGLWRRDTGGWTKVRSPRELTVGAFRATYEGMPVVQVVAEGAARLLAFSKESGEWVDLRLPSSLAPEDPTREIPVFGVRGDLYAASPAGKGLGRLRDGVWTALQPEVPCTWGKVVETAGDVFAICGRVFRVVGDSLVPDFTELEGRLDVTDILDARGVRYLAGRASGSGGLWDSEAERPALVAFIGGNLTAILDSRDDVASSPSLASAGGHLLVEKESYPGAGSSAGYFVVGIEGLREARADGFLPAFADRDGRFAWAEGGGRWTTPSYRGPLLVPEVRVRKTIPACVDAVGHGGVRYRSTLLLANLTDRQLTARVEYGYSTGVATDVSLALWPHEQWWVEDPCPGYVGPLSITFEGAEDDREAFALLRVHSPSEGGSAGTSLVGVDSGSFTGTGVLLQPAVSAGDRLHLALANAGDGAHSSFGGVVADPPDLGPADWKIDFLGAGELRQTDSLPRVSGATRFVADVGPHGDDLLGYVVRNDGRTNDGAVIPFEPPDPLPSRKTRFLPAVVSLSSPYARYRTELSIARRRYAVPQDEARVRTYRVRYRSSSSGPAPVSGSFAIRLRLADVMRIADVGAWLAANGVPVDPQAVDGTLTFTCDESVGAADLVVTAIVLGSARTGPGEYGVTVPLVNEGRWATTSVIVPGLVEDEGLRSNLAVANPEPEGGPDVLLTVSIHNGFDGERVGALPPVTLRPGERFQFHRPLRQVDYGAGNAYAVVQRTGGSGRFVAYGVLNDAVTSDGTYLPMVPDPTTR